MTAVSVSSITSDPQARHQRSRSSISRDRAWALRWSYFFLIFFAIVFLTPPVYMLITSLKTSDGVWLGG